MCLVIRQEMLSQAHCGEMLLGTSCPWVTLWSPALPCKRWGQGGHGKEDKEGTEPRPGVLRCHQLEESRYAHRGSELYTEAQKLHAWKFSTASLVHKSNTMQAWDPNGCMGCLVKTLIQILLLTYFGFVKSSCSAPFLSQCCDLRTQLCLLYCY